MICRKCGAPFKSYARIDGKGRTLKNRKFCLTCSPFNQHNTTKLDGPSKPKCLVCGKPLKRRDRKFCSNTCQNKKQQEDYIEKWLAGKETGNQPGKLQVSGHVRAHLFKINDNKCKCGWAKVNPTTGKIPLTVNHKDGNSENSTPENLELLCPSCHALTPNYGVLNKGNGRRTRINIYKIQSEETTQTVTLLTHNEKLNTS